MTLPTSSLPAALPSVPRATLYTLLMLIFAAPFHVQHFPHWPIPGQHFLEVATAPRLRRQLSARPGRRRIAGSKKAGDPGQRPIRPESATAAPEVRTR